MDYHTRLELGRVHASVAVLDTLSRALRLDEDQQSHLYEVAGQTDDRPRRTRPDQPVRPAVRRLLTQLAETPALVLGTRLDVLAWNRSAVALYTDFAATPADRRNHPRRLFTDCDTWAASDGSGQRLTVLPTETGSPSHDAPRILTAWTAAGPARAGPGQVPAATPAV